MYNAFYAFVRIKNWPKPGPGFADVENKRQTGWQANLNLRPQGLFLVGLWRYVAVIIQTNFAYGTNGWANGMTTNLPIQYSVELTYSSSTTYGPLYTAAELMVPLSPGDIYTVGGPLSGEISQVNNSLLIGK